MKRLTSGLGLLLVLVVAALGVRSAVEARRPRGDDFEQLRALIARGAAAAARREMRSLAAMIADDYRDPNGLTAPALRAQIARAMRQYRRIAVDIPAETLQLQVQQDRRSAYTQFEARITLADASGERTVVGTYTVAWEKRPVRYLLFFPGEEWKVVSVSGYEPDF